MARIRLRAGAEADLIEIREYSIDTFGEAVALDYLGSFQQAFELLERHPHAGAIRTEFDPPIHCLHRRHRIFYDVDGDTVWIVRVLHHAMDTKHRL